MKMDERPLVSVIIPIYNVEDYIHECINSVLSQTYQNIEVILIDAGSKDRCPEICDEYVEKDKRVRVIHKTNEGLSDARNCGIKNSEGEYLTFIDSDDVISSDMIQYLYRLCIQYDVLLAQCNYVTESPVFDAIIDGQERGTLISKERCMNELFGKYGTSFCVSWGKLFHRTLFDTTEFPVGKAHEDVYTTHLYFEAAEKIVFTTKRLYYYRQREGSKMYTERNKLTWDELRADMTRAKYFKEKGYLDVYRKQLWVCIYVLKEQYHKFYAVLSSKQKKQMKKIYRKIMFGLIKQKQKYIPMKFWLLDDSFFARYIKNSGGR